VNNTLLIIGITILVFACTPKQNKTDEESKNDSLSAIKDTSDPMPDADSIVKMIEAENSRIESNMNSLVKTSLKTTDLRAQIKQKWSQIEYFSDKSGILKIVTVPYPQITKRTEEFTFKEGKLILAVISDEGIDEGKDPEKGVDKEYYYLY
jgi:hypothetical protein